MTRKLSDSHFWGEGGGEEVLPYKRLMGMSRWKGSHFHDRIDFNGVAFSIESLEWCRTFSEFWGKTVLYIYGKQTYQDVVLEVKSKVFFIQFKKMGQFISG